MRRHLAAPALAFGLAAFAAPALAVTVRDCDGVTESAASIVEPWEQNTQTFYQGRVRVASLDTGGEPACCSAHLLILFWADERDGPGALVCRLVSADGDRGFSGIDFKSLRSRYDPARGLSLSFGYSVFPPGGDGSVQTKGVARIRVNLAGASVTAE